MKKLLIVMLLCLPVLLASCKKAPQEVTITNVVFTVTSGTYEFSIDEFLLEDIKLSIIYSDGTSEVVSLTKDMLSTADFEALLTSGEHLVEVNCEGRKLIATINLTATETGQNRLPVIVLYNMVEENQGKYENVYYTTGTGTFISFQLQYQFDSNQVTEVEVTPGTGLSGSFVSNVSEGLVTITYSQTEPTNDPEPLFTISCTSTQKYNNFTQDATFNNRFYGLDTNIFEIKSISYFTR